MSAKTSLSAKKDLPPAPALRKLIGPSFIILGLGLGSGEVIMWPYLASNFGLGIVWGMVVGITMQFFINMEVERYALINGESVFVGFKKVLRWLPVWFILTTFFAWAWPGIGLTGANLLAATFDIGSVKMLGILLFIGIGAILTIGKVVYKTVERLQMVLIGIGVPFMVILTAYLTDLPDLGVLLQGLVGQGDGYRFLPEGIVMGTFLGALAYAGAGGNLNLAQSFYVRDKGYGMGVYADRITSVLTGSGSAQKIRLTGTTFPVTKKNIGNFRQWWKVVNLEHALVFWALGLFTMLTLSLLAYVTTYGMEGNAQGIQFVLNEAGAIAGRTLPIFGTLFLLVTGVMLTATQLTVLDSTSRIMTENLLLLKRGNEQYNVSRLYYVILWFQILFGIAVISLGFSQPRQLITLGAIINAFTMFSYTGILLYLNNRLLAKELRPSIWRNFALVFTFLFFGFFCVQTILEYV